MNFKKNRFLQKSLIWQQGIYNLFWYALDKKGYYLTEISCQAMTSEYLLEVLRGKVFRIEKKEILKCTPMQNTTKADLYIKIKELIQNKQLKDLGFILANLPKKQWLISVLYALNFYDQVFLKPKTDDIGLVTKEDLELLKQLDTTLFRSKKPGFLKRTKKQRVAIIQKKREHKLQKLKKKVDKKRFDLVRCTQLANEYEKQIQHIKKKAQENQMQN